MPTGVSTTRATPSSPTSSRPRFSPLEVDVALLPVNGRDSSAGGALGIVGNMNAVEAVELALAVDATWLVAYH